MPPFLILTYPMICINKIVMHMRITVNLLLFILLLATIVSCANNGTAADLLNDPEEQDEVLTVIANDSTLLAKLHDKLNVDGQTNMNGSNRMMHPCMAMMDNPEMMNMMMDNMMMRCEEDSAMCMMMCDKMMGSKDMRSMMQDRMKDMNMGKGNK